MDIVVDASSVINLDNAGALALVASLQCCSLLISPLVVGECAVSCALEIKRLQMENRIRLVDPEQIPAELFLHLLEEHKLGEGETECIALCAVGQFSLCCDDYKARQVASELIGVERVLGSLRLLKWTVREGLSTAPEAFDVYNEMKSSGGFLPTLDANWFNSEDQATTCPEPL